jgi:hypothetical protein
MNNLTDEMKELMIEFALWTHHLDNGTTHYNPFTEEETPSIGFSPWDSLHDEFMTPERLLEEFLSIKDTID